MMGTSKLRKRLLLLFAIIVLVIVVIRYFYTKDQPHFRKPDQPITDENISQLQLLTELNSPIEYSFQYLSGTIEFSSNSQIIMIGYAEGATVWDSSGTKLRHFNTVVRHNNCDDYASNFSLSPDGTLLVASYIACLQSDMQLWSITTGELLKSFGPDRGLNTLDFSPDSSLILYDYNGKGYVYEIKTDKEILLDNQTLGQMVFASNSNDVFYRANYPKLSKFKKWDAGTGSVETLTDQLPDAVAFALSPSDTLLAIQDETRIILWDIAANTEVNVIETSLSTYWNMEFSSNGRLLILRSTERVIIWDISFQTEILTVNANSYTNVFDSIVSISSDLLVYYQSPGIISIWNLKTQQQATRLKSRSIRPPLAFSPDGTLLVSYSGHVWGIP